VRRHGTWPTHPNTFESESWLRKGERAKLSLHVFILQRGRRRAIFRELAGRELGIVDRELCLRVEPERRGRSWSRRSAIFRELQRRERGSGRLCPNDDACRLLPLAGAGADVQRRLRGGSPVDAGACSADLNVALEYFLAQQCPRGFEPTSIVSGPLAGYPATECCYQAVLEICGSGE
jgi:hypothetical protein